MANKFLFAIYIVAVSLAAIFVCLTHLSIRDSVIVYMAIGFVSNALVMIILNNDQTVKTRIAVLEGKV